MEAAESHGSKRSYWIHLDPERNETLHNEFEAIVYFPGFGVTGPVPLIVFAHGWGGAGDWYEFFAGALVPYGYVMASIDVSRSLDNSPSDMAANQEFLVTAMLNQSATNESSPIYKMLNGKAATSGHSNGGAASLISQAEQGTKNWNSLATLSAAYPHDIKNLSVIVNPALIMTGTKDCVCPPPSNGYPIYQQIGSKCKYYINLINGTHCHFWEEKAPIEDVGCNQFLEFRCYHDHIPMHQQWSLVSKYILPWYDYTLKGKQDRLQLIDTMLKADQEDGVLLWEKVC